MFFQFEADFVDSLRCIPMQVRLKLDTCGVKLNLAQWHQFTATERQQLVELPCHEAATLAAYRDYLQHLVCHYQGSPAKTLSIDTNPSWLNAQAMPAEVKAQAESLGYSLTLTQWQALSPLQRFALIKLSRPGHENRNFQAALAEFGLSQTPCQ
ncbi:MAG: nitrate reductase maturation protein NarM [Leptolyngbyaceae cyanobacterium SM2_5_2]|nr:nitrate reductase maturation protein NarM [Leptolyngbyaceae cyanobacterium SM2_5_2]